MTSHHDEGIIKYQHILDKKDHGYSDLAAILEIYRTQLKACDLLGVYKDCGLGYGNISAKITTCKTTQFLITGSQTSGLESLDHSGYVLITQYGLKDQVIHATGMINASSESLTHAAIYESHPDITFVVHIHHSQIWKSYLKNKQGLITPPNLEYGTLDMALACRNLIHHPQGVIAMAGHIDGVIYFGTDLEVIVNKVLKDFKES